MSAAKEHELGNGVKFIFLSSGDAIWKHNNCRPWFPIDLTSGTHHKVIAGGPDDMENFEIKGSLLCVKCGRHGYVENGKWRDV